MMIEYLMEKCWKSGMMAKLRFLRSLDVSGKTPAEVALKIIEAGFPLLVMDELEWLVENGGVNIRELTSRLIKGKMYILVATKMKIFVDRGAEPEDIVKWFIEARRGDEIVRFFSQFLANGIEAKELVLQLIKAGNGVEVLDLLYQPPEQGRITSVSLLLTHGITAEMLAGWLKDNDDSEIIRDNINNFIAAGARIEVLEAMLE